MKRFIEGDNNFPKSLLWQKKLVKDAEKFADYILVSTPDLKEIIPSAEYFPVMLDLEKFLKELGEAKESRKNKDEIVILHSPSNFAVKGSEYIHKILRKVAAESKHQIRLLLPAEELRENPKVYSVTRYQLFELYKEADIVIDQMILGWYGLQSVEAIAAGKQAISYVDENLKLYLFPDCPIKIADITTLESTVKECIENILSRQSYSTAKQLEWVKKYHTIENNNNPLLRAWNLLPKN